MAWKWTKTFDVLILPMASKKIRMSKVIFDFPRSFWRSDFWRSDFWHSDFWHSDFWRSNFWGSDFWRSDQPLHFWRSDQFKKRLLTFWSFSNFWPFFRLLMFWFLTFWPFPVNFYQSLWGKIMLLKYRHSKDIIKSNLGAVQIIRVKFLEHFRPPPSPLVLICVIFWYPPLNKYVLISKTPPPLPEKLIKISMNCAGKHFFN